jgi:hypothetical protein
MEHESRKSFSPCAGHKTAFRLYFPLISYHLFSAFLISVVRLIVFFFLCFGFEITCGDISVKSMQFLLKLTEEIKYR